ncbi:MAG TPA: hypothetical protein VIL11_03625, partial [Limnochordales bacterium]
MDGTAPARACAQAQPYPGPGAHNRQGAAWRSRLERLRPLAVPAATALLLLAGWWVERRSGGFAVEAPRRLQLVALALYGAAYLVGGWEPARRGLAAVAAGRVDIDFLMVAAAAGAFAIGQPKDGSVLIFIFALGNALEHYALAHTRRAIESLVQLRPTQARRLKPALAQSQPPGGEQANGTAAALHPGLLETVPVEQLQVGDIVQLLPGERLAVDGVVVQGHSAVDASAITGES